MVGGILGRVRLRRAHLWGLIASGALVTGLAGCDTRQPTTGGDAGGGASDGGRGADDASLFGIDGGGDSQTFDGGRDSGPAPRDVCNRWLTDTADVSEGRWTGSPASCEAGTMDEGWLDRALTMTNLARWLAGLDAVELDASRNARAQQCALMMHANGALSHGPPPSWACYSEAGAEAAGRSNLATAPAVQSVFLYMIDPGNEDTLGHRRWIISNSTGPMGFGSTDRYSCMWVLGGSGAAGREWTAWPPPGDFPIQAVGRDWADLNDTGWSIQSDSIDVTRFDVSVSEGERELPVNVRALRPNYGSRYAISFRASGWRMEAGTTYSVVAEGPGPDERIAYDVRIVDCAP